MMRQPVPAVRASCWVVRKAVYDVQGAFPYVRGAMPYVRGALPLVQRPLPYVRGTILHVQGPFPNMRGPLPLVRRPSPHKPPVTPSPVGGNMLKIAVLPLPATLALPPATSHMATPRPRIPIPTTKDPVGVLDLSGMVLKKHLADGKDSPIRGQLKTDFEAVSKDIDEGTKDDAEAKELAKKLEAIYERRNARVARVQPLLSRVSKALQSEYGPAGVHRLGEHGFTVDDAPRPPKASPKG